MEKVKIKLLPGGKIPVYSTPGAAGADLFTAESCIIWPFVPKKLKTNLSVEMAEGYEAQIRGRSGLAFKKKVFAFNGTIDSDYRGKIGVLLVKIGFLPVRIKKGDRIAQIVIKPVEQFDFIESEDLNDTERGAGGFGSTGK